METKENKFECCVCYEDGSTVDPDVSASGKIITKCKHDICGACYTKVLIKDGNKALCPICRQNYCKQEVTPEEDYGNHLETLIQAINLITPPRIRRTEFILTPSLDDVTTRIDRLAHYMSLYNIQ